MPWTNCIGHHHGQQCPPNNFPQGQYPLHTTVPDSIPPLDSIPPIPGIPPFSIPCRQQSAVIPPHLSHPHFSFPKPTSYHHPFQKSGFLPPATLPATGPVPMGPLQGAAGPFQGSVGPIKAQPMGKKKRERVVFSRTTVKRLHQLYQKAQYPSPEDILRVSEELELTCTQVKVWFQNHRHKEKKRAPPTSF